MPTLYSVTDKSTGGRVEAQGNKYPDGFEEGETVTLIPIPNAGYEYVANSLSATNNSTGEAIALTDNGDGTWSFQMPAASVTVTATFSTNDPQEGITITQNGSVNMPVSGTTTVNIPDGVTKFYVYDDGGPSGNFSDDCNGQVLLIAPEGKLLKVNGTVTGGIGDERYVLVEYATLAIYDGSSTSATNLYQNSYGSVSNITSSGKQMLLHFYDIDNVITETAAGFSLTVEVIEPTTHSITIADGITHGTVTADKTSAMTGETVTLTVTPDVGYELENITGVTVTSIGNNQYTFIMPDEDVTISASIHVSSLFGYKYEYGDIFNNYIPDGSADYPYIISSADGWNLFCDCLAEENNTTWNRFSGKTVKLGANIGTAQDPVTRMAGSSGHDFCGTFDGQGNTLTVKYGESGTPASVENVAPFSYVSNVGSETAAIENLHVAGDIYTSAKYAAGIVGKHWGTLNIKNCRSSIVIHSSVSGDGTHGGFEGASNGTLNIEGCVFDGKLLSKNTGNDATTLCGGFVGYGTCTITNSLYAPAGLDDGETEITNGSCTFVRNATPGTNCYYTRLLGTAQGKAARNIEAGENVTVALSGTATEYTVSGITAYKDGETQLKGLKYGDVLYAGSGDAVSLTLSNTGAPAGYQYAGYTASAGTLDDNNILTMPDEDVTVSLALTVLPWDGYGTESSPYIIYNKDQLDLLAHRVNGTHGETANNYYNTYFQLANDISYTHTSAWNAFTSDESNYQAIGGIYDGNDRYFSGHFDGNNKTISGIRIYKDGDDDTDMYQGIFGRTASGADIHDLTLADARITGNYNTGGIVGYNVRSTVTRCHVAGDVAVCAVLSDTFYHGGIVGYNYRGTIEQCTSAATLTDAYISKYYGGIAGCNDYGTLCDNLAIGATVPAAEDNSYGAITGNNYKGTLQRNYYAACKVANTENATGVGCGYIDDGNGGLIVADVTDDNNPDGAVCINTLALAANQAPDQNYWTTYYNSALGFTIDADEHACAYTATYGAGQLTLHRLGKVIPKGTAVIIVGEDNSIGMTALCNAVAEYSVGNNLRGEDVRTSLDDIKTARSITDGTFYVMGKVGSDFGFFKYTAQYMPARKAYLLVSGSAAPGLKMVFDDEETNSLSPIPSPSREGGAGEWYTLDGRKFDKQPTQKGIYIVNGKKVVIN